MPFKVVPPLYSIWQGMRQRCRNPNFKQFADYGGRGIKICERWGSYENFERDMGRRPKGTQLDRIDNDGDYEPSNCRWATRLQQMRNQRTTRWVTISGKRYRVAELAAKSGIKGDIIISRANRGLGLSGVLSKKRYYNTNNWHKAVAVRVANQIARTHCKRGHPLSGDNMYRNKHGGRVCRTCEKAKHARKAATRKAERAAKRAAA